MLNLINILNKILVLMIILVLNKLVRGFVDLL